MATKRKNPARTTVDKPAAHELYSWIMYGQPGRAVVQRRQTVVDNLVKKFNKGTYDHSKAPKAWSYVVTEAAKDYANRYKTSYSAMFNKATRDHVAKHLADDHLKMMKTLSKKNPVSMTAKQAAATVARLKKNIGTPAKTKKNPCGSKLTRLKKYGEVYKKSHGGFTAYVRGIFQQNKGDSYHARVERNGRAVWTRDFPLGRKKASEVKTAARQAAAKELKKRADKLKKLNLKGIATKKTNPSKWLPAGGSSKMIKGYKLSDNAQKRREALYRGIKRVGLVVTRHDFEKFAKGRWDASTKADRNKMQSDANWMAKHYWTLLQDKPNKPRPSLKNPMTAKQAAATVARLKKNIGKPSKAQKNGPSVGRSDGATSRVFLKGRKMHDFVRVSGNNFAFSGRLTFVREYGDGMAAGFQDTKEPRRVFTILDNSRKKCHLIEYSRGNERSLGLVKKITKIKPHYKIED